MWISNIWRTIWGTKEEKKTPTTQAEAEELARQEMLMRLVDTPRSQTRRARDGGLFEQFVVVGVEEQPQPLIHTHNPNSKHSGVVGADVPKSALKPNLKPKILFRYPENSTFDAHLQTLEDFCFPNGIDSDLVPHVKIPDNMNNLDPSQVIPYGKLREPPPPRASIKNSKSRISKIQKYLCSLRKPKKRVTVFASLTTFSKTISRF